VRFHSSIVAIFIAIFLTSCSHSKKSDEESLVAKNRYTLTDLHQKQYTITKKQNQFIQANTEGKVVLYDLFATWCPPCNALAPHLSSLQKKFPDTLVIMGVSIEKDISNNALQAFLKKHNASYTLVNSKDNRALASAIASSIGVGSNFPIPLVVMFKDGHYITHYEGLVPEEMMQSDIQRALKQ